MAGGVGSDGERPWIVVGDRLKGAKGWWRLGAVIVVGIMGRPPWEGAWSCVEELSGLEASDGV